MNSRKNVKVDGKIGWKLSRLVGRDHLSIGSSFTTNTERTSTNFQTEAMEEPADNMWLSLEFAKAHADKLRNRII